MNQVTHDPATPQAAAPDPGEWVGQHADALFRRALAQVRRREVAEDLVQDTFLAAWEGRHRFERRASERTWLFRILRNKIADYFRANARTVEVQDLEVLAGFEAAQFHSSGGGVKWCRAAIPLSWGNVQESVENAEFWSTVHRCTDRLPEKVARVFLLREVDQWETPEICAELNINRNHLFVLLHRARLALRHCLERHWFAAEPNPPDK